jgi:hypothetical protein
MSEVLPSSSEQPARPPDSPGLAAAEQALDRLAEAEQEPPAERAPHLAAAHQALAAMLDEEPAADTERP